MKQSADTINLAPTDLSNFLSCRHLSSLDLEATRGGAERPARYGAFLDDLRARGFAHEKAYLDHLKRQGLSVAEIVSVEADSSSRDGGHKKTIDAMTKGVDVIYQAHLSDVTWSGRADFLRKVSSPSGLGDWSYEVIDTKLAQETKAGTILQLCVYSYLLEKMQGKQPLAMHVVRPGNNYVPLSYLVDDYAAYFRLLERGIGEFIVKPGATYPEMVSHCDYCAWWSLCEKRRRGDDHLCYVAGISTTQIKTLRTFGVNRLAALACLDEVPDPAHGSKEALIRVRDQARVQQIGRDKGAPYHELKTPFDQDHGLALLPEPSADDIFLDFEGNHFVDEGVHEYLTGYVTKRSTGEFEYTAFWATTHEEERKAFEQFIDIAIAARTRNPAAHIYHFAPYEPSALKRLCGRYATREVELDELLRGRAFVDLYALVKRSLIASVERYSIKDLEPFFGYERHQDLREASMSRRLLENAIEMGDLSGELDQHWHNVADYNREDCESTSRLRDWLEQLRTDLIAEGRDLTRPDTESGEAPDEIGALDRRLQGLRDRLLEDVPIEPGERSADQHARFALAHMMEFHRREDKASWWDYFRLLDLEEDDFPDERRAITGLQFEKPIDQSKAPLQRFSFPAQELDARKGDNIYDKEGDVIGTVADIHYSDHSIDIKKRMDRANVHPTAVVLHSRVRADPLRESLVRLGDHVLANGFAESDPYRAATELLLRRIPAIVGDPLEQPGETTVQAACRLALKLDGQVLAIQGPPGTGKTYTGAHVICALKRQGLRVGVTAVSHKVIVNLLEGAAAEAEQQGLQLSLAHRQKGQYEGDWGIRRENRYEAIRLGLQDGSIDVVGATGWCWARPDFEQSVDVLIVDEAGQMSLSNVLAAAPGGRSLILLGDPQQLEQPLQSSHPESSDVSALYHLLDGEDTMPADKGLFLAETYRLHPDIVTFTSEVYYEGKVNARPELERQAIVPTDGSACRFLGSGLRYVPVNHGGNQARAAEEVSVIKEIVEELLAGGLWRDAQEETRPLTEKDVLIVAPYNAQVAALSEALPTFEHRIGTVDRFQGQEAPVVIYSMTSSSPEDAPRGMEFLYNRNRFNVATSRARALCILVGTPALFEPECHSPRQMKMANGFCRYLELAEVIET